MIKSLLKFFLDRKHISQHVENTIPDNRHQEPITYSKQSIILSALVIFLFRMASGNQFDCKSHDGDEKYCKANVSKFIDAPENRAPVIKTIENFLNNLPRNSINHLMIDFFKDLVRSKFFRQHPQILQEISFCLQQIVFIHTLIDHYTM